MLYDDVFRVTKAFFSVVDCGNCNNREDKMACDYCSNHCEHNLLWNVDDNMVDLDEFLPHSLMTYIEDKQSKRYFIRYKKTVTNRNESKGVKR